MKKRNAKITALCVAAGMVLCEGSLPVLAAGTDVVLAGMGDFSRPEQAEEATEAAEATEVETAEDATIEAAPAEDTTTEAEPTQVASTQDTQEDHFVPDPDAIGTTAFALCDEYLNVRSEADKESAPVGKLYNFGSMEIIDVDENGWYKIRSGNVEGYVAGQYLATGSLAEEIAADAGYTTAEVGVEALHLRASADQEGEIISTISPDHEVEVVEDGGDWVKVVVDGTYGYVSSDYVYTSTEYATAVAVDEPGYEASYEEPVYEDTYEEPVYEEPAYVEPAYEEPSYEEAAYSEPTYEESSYEEASYTEPAYEESYTEEAAYTEPTYEESYYEEASYTEPTYEESYYEEASYTEPTYEESYYEEQAQAASTSAYDAQVYAQEQYQAFVEAQNAADEMAVSTADEQAVIDSAAAASEAYQAYVEAQNAADAAAQAEADALAQAEAAAQTYTETYDDGSSYEDTYTEDTYTEDSYTEDTYTEDSYTETYEDTSYDDSYSYEESYEDTSYEDTSSYSYSSTGQAVADFATQYVGGPYVWGGSSLTGGADCSGFVMAVYQNFGISLPHNAAAQSGYGTSVSMDNLQPGDLLFYNGDGGIGHVSIYIGGGQVVHASNPTNGIIISDIGYRTPCCATRLV